MYKLLELKEMELPQLQEIAKSLGIKKIDSTSIDKLDKDNLIYGISSRIRIEELINHVK